MSVVACTICGAEIAWAMTFHGHILPFDHPPVSADLDLLREGWAPGTWPVRGRRRIVFAPIIMSSPAKQERIAMVVFPHACRVSASQVS